MIISHKHKFIFIKTRKTAGTSIEVYLNRFCDDQDILTPILPSEPNHSPRNYKGFFNPLVNCLNQNFYFTRRSFYDVLHQRKFYNHIPAQLVKNRVHNDIWNNYFKFCIERNPWDKTLSHYYMRKSRLNENMSLDDYFNEGSFCTNYPQYLDGNFSEPIVDHVAKYENINDELRYVFEKVGIPFEGELNIKSKGTYRKEKKHYREIFTKEQAEMIRKIFSKEIELHNYDIK